MSRFVNPFAMGAISAALLASLPAHASSTTELEALQAQIQSLRQDYESRLQALEAQLAQHAQRATTEPTPPIEPAATHVASSNGFNPAVSLVLSGTYANLSRDPETWELGGFRLGGHGHGVGPGKRGFSLDESELTLSANIDNLAYGALTLALTADNEVEVEEAFVQSNALPHGLTLKGGRFFSALGYLNEKHAHTWDFVDLPFTHQAFLGGQHRQEGAQLSWVLPTDHFIELNAELGNGGQFPGSERGNNGLGSTLLSARTGGDVGASHTWRVGASWLRAKAHERAWHNGPHDHGHAGHDEHDEDSTTFSGTSQIWALDGIWKWAPNGNATSNSFTLQGEYFWRNEKGQAELHGDHPEAGAYRSKQSGWYLQGIYQFMPKWRVGLRHDRLDSGSLKLGGHLDHHLAHHDHQPQRTSVMLDWSPSEFQRWRLQVNQDKAREGLKDTQLYLQYQMNLGAHGAHTY